MMKDGEKIMRVIESYKGWVSRVISMNFTGFFYWFFWGGKGKEELRVEFYLMILGPVGRYGVWEGLAGEEESEGLN